MKHRPPPVRDNSSFINTSSIVIIQRYWVVQIHIKRIDRSGPESKDVNRLFHPRCMRRGCIFCAFLAGQTDFDPHIPQFGGPKKAARRASQLPITPPISYYYWRNATTFPNLGLRTRFSNKRYIELLHLSFLSQSVTGTWLYWSKLLLLYIDKFNPLSEQYTTGGQWCFVDAS